MLRIMKLKYMLLGLVSLHLLSCNDNDDQFTVYEGTANTEIGKVLLEKTETVMAMIKKDSSYTVTEGVKTTEVEFLSFDGYAKKMFISEIDLTTEGLTIEASTPNNSPAFGMQKMTEQAIYEDAVGHQVWAGINGDFFDTGNGIPRGIVYKEGTAIKTSMDSSVSTWFAINNDGTASIGSRSEFSGANARFVEAVSGRATLVQDGLVYKWGSDVPLEPRTAIGVSEDGLKVYMLVVDGRNFTYSNGIDYQHMSEIFLALGAYDAINLDGGGSSTFFTRTTSDFTDDRFEIRNWPSDNGGAERNVANGLLVIKQ